MLVVGTYKFMYVCCMDVCNSLFVAMLMPYSLMTCIKIYFIRNIVLTVPYGSNATYSLCRVLKSSNLTTLASLRIIHSLCYKPTSNGLIIDVSITIK